MTIIFNTILRQAGLALTNRPPDPGHKDKRATRGRNPYELWRDNRPQFEMYQTSQSNANRKKFKAPCWAVFIVNPNDEKHVGGLYNAKSGSTETRQAHAAYKVAWKRQEPAMYMISLWTMPYVTLLGDFSLIGVPQPLRGSNMRIGTISPLRNCGMLFQEEDFPGFLNFIQPLSNLDNLPKSWTTVLESSLESICSFAERRRNNMLDPRPATKGSGFAGRITFKRGTAAMWVLRAGNQAIISSEFLEVAGSSASTDDIRAMEGRWQRKLQSKDMGLNRNLAGRS